MYAWHPHHVLVQDPPRLAPALRRHRGHQAARRGGDHRRQDQPRRVRHGVEHRELCVRTYPQSPRHLPRAGRLQRWIGCGGGRRVRSGESRVRHGRLDPPAGSAVRRGRGQAHLRRGEPIRPGGLCVEPRPDRPLRQRRRRRRTRARSDLRPRPDGLHVDPPRPTRHQPTARHGRRRPAHRPHHRPAGRRESRRRCPPRRSVRCTARRGR